MKLELEIFDMRFEGRDYVVIEREAFVRAFSPMCKWDKDGYFIGAGVDQQDTTVPTARKPLAPKRPKLNHDALPPELAPKSRRFTTTRLEVIRQEIEAGPRTEQELLTACLASDRDMDEMRDIQSALSHLKTNNEAVRDSDGRWRKATE